MEKVPVFVGLDYHQDGVQVCVLDAGGRMLLNARCANEWEAVCATAQRCGAVVSAANESCAGAADLADELVGEAKWVVNLAHPGFVSRMKQNPDKTDFTDARMLADLERVGYLPKVWLAPQEVRELRRLVRYRQQLVDEQRALKLRIRSALREQRARPEEECRAWTKRWLAWLETTDQISEESHWIIVRQLRRLGQLAREIDAVETRLARRTVHDPLVQALLKTPGIGPVTAWVIRAEIGRFDRFRTGKQLSRFCGLSPRNASSGARQADAGLIQAGNRTLRATLIEAAHRLIRYEARWTTLARQWLERGKPKCVVVAAVANRWMRRLFHDLQPGRLAA